MAWELTHVGNLANTIKSLSKMKQKKYLLLDHQTSSLNHLLPLTLKLLIIQTHPDHQKKMLILIRGLLMMLLRKTMIPLSRKKILLKEKRTFLHLLRRSLKTRIKVENLSPLHPNSSSLSCIGKYSKSVLEEYITSASSMTTQTPSHTTSSNSSSSQTIPTSPLNSQTSMGKELKQTSDAINS